MKKSYRIGSRSGRKHRKRWAPGQAASLNPNTMKHRSKVNLMKLQFTTVNPKDDVDMDSSASTIDTNITNSTWASTFSNCTNSTFSTIIDSASSISTVSSTGSKRNQHYDEKVHNAVLSSLSAVTEVIRSQRDDGSDGNDTDYFACIVSVLDSVVDDEARATALLYLCSLVCRKTSRAVLTHQFDNILRTLTNIQARFSGTSKKLFFKSWIRCYGFVISAQPAHVLSDPVTFDRIRVLFAYVSDQRHRVRKCAHSTIVSLANRAFKTSETAGRALANSSVDYCLTKIAEMGFRDQSVITSWLSLLSSFVHMSSTTSLVKGCETLLKLMTHGDNALRMLCLQSLANLFNSNLCSLNADQNCQILNALFDFKPNKDDAGITCAWIIVVTASICSLFKISPTMGWLHLPRLVHTFVRNLESEARSVRKITAKSLSTLLKCSLGFQNNKSVSDAVTATALKRVMGELSHGVSMKYCQAWPEFFPTIAHLFQVLTRENFELVSPFISTLGDLRMNSNVYSGDGVSRTTQIENEIDKALCSAVSTFGTRKVLSLIPLTFSKTKIKFQPEWLMLIVVNSVDSDELAFFREFFLPIAISLKAAHDQAPESASSQKALMKNTEICIWNMFPKFCTNPDDPEEFHHLAKGIGMSISKHDYLRVPLLNGLSNLLDTVITGGDKLEPTRLFLQANAKNFLPIFLNIASNGSPSVGSYVLTSCHRVIEQYFSITPDHLIETYTKMVIAKHEDSTQVPHTVRLTNLMICLLSRMGADKVEWVLNVALAHINSGNGKRQKRGFRMVEKIMKETTNREACKHVVAKRISDIRASILTTSQASTIVSDTSQLNRLRCMRHLLSIDSDLEVIDIFKLVIPHLKSDSRQRSLEALKVFMDASEKVVRDEKSISSDVDNFAKLLQSVVFRWFNESSRDDVACQCLCIMLGKLSSDYRDFVSGSSAIGIFELLTELMNQQSYCDKTFAYIFSACGPVVLSMDNISLLKLAPSILGKISQSLKLLRSHGRKKMRLLLTHLSRRLGSDVISKMQGTINPIMSKLIRNIRKEATRKDKKRKQYLKQKSNRQHCGGSILSEVKRAGLQEDLTSEISDDDDFANERSLIASLSATSLSDDKRRRTTRKRKGDAADMMGIRDDSTMPLDLCDNRSVVRNMVHSVRRSEITDNQDEAPFKLDNDGKIVIGRPDGEDEKTNSDEDGDDAISLFPHKIKKRKQLEGDSFLDAEKMSTRTGKSRRSTYSKLTPITPKKVRNGDGRRQDGLQPYSYIQLDTRHLNRRNKHKAKDQFKHVIRKAHSGVRQGSKHPIVRGR